MGINVKGRLTFKHHAYAALAKSDLWQKTLKPDLLEMINDASKSEALLDTSFQTIKRDITRAITIKVINKIINLIESAESKVDGKYKKPYDQSKNGE